MHIQRTRPDRVTARQRDPGPFAPPDQRSQHTDRGAELPHRSEVGIVLRLVRCGDPGHVTVEFDGGAQTTQYLRHQRHIEDVGTVGDRAGALGQQRRSHELEHAVLGAADGHFA
ncbi:Uncharacterised protein [Mycobacterium tuberculosis]|uniref:Uncharacterized protein n=1 Tax=Mycobacterium tuberculosis TaxID=1773 RepID=A0A916PD66_MYCTX|nr:Uncharacterised protein [Mycobacterium tuberculosis]